MDLKINSISSLLFFVSDLDVTKEFYTKLGFKFTDTGSDDFIKLYVNWFSIEFVRLDKAEESVYKDLNDKYVGTGVGKSGQYNLISVLNVDNFYEAVVKAGIKPASEPKTFPWKRREFVVIDPDGYKLIFFQKK